MRQMTHLSGERKPSPAQARWITEALDNGQYRMNIPERSRRIMIAAGWMVERLNYPSNPQATPRTLDHVTDAARMAVGRADTITIPDVAPGDVLVYRTHPGCAFRVTEVVAGKYGQAFRGATVSVCHSGHTVLNRVGQDEHTADFDVPAYLVRPENAAELTARVEREMDAQVANQASPQYRHFAKAVRVGKSYAAAMDILHAEAITEGLARKARGLLATARARTGRQGAALLVSAQERAALTVEGQVLAGVAQAAKANGCPPLCDASAVLHIVVASAWPTTGLRGMDAWPSWPLGAPRRGGLLDATRRNVFVSVPETGNRDFRPINQGREVAAWRLSQGAAF